MNSSFKVEIAPSGSSAKVDIISGGSTAKVHIGGSQVITQIKGKILTNTVAGWNSQLQLQSELNTIYVYSDYAMTTDEHGQTVFVPGVKIGDGKAFLVDLPFADVLMDDHIHDTDVHITPEERRIWNNKVSVYVPSALSEDLIFTTS